jgi:hypothetical protein
MVAFWSNIPLAFCPFEIIACFGEKQYDEALKFKKIKRMRIPYKKDAFVYAYRKNNTIDFCIIRFKIRPPGRAETVGIVVHECIHLWQYIKETLGEESPSPEFEAYAMQSLAQSIYSEFEKHNVKKFKKRQPSSLD